MTQGLIILPKGSSQVADVEAGVGRAQWLVSWPQDLVEAPSLLPCGCQRSPPQPRQPGLAAQARTNAFSLLAIATRRWASITQCKASPLCQHPPSVDTTLALNSPKAQPRAGTDKGKKISQQQCLSISSNV